MVELLPAYFLLTYDHTSVSVPCRPVGFFSKILKKRPHKEAQTPDNGEITPIFGEKSLGGEGK